MMSNQTFPLIDVAARERSILKNVYMWMTGALAVTGFVAYFVSVSPGLIMLIFSSRFAFYGILIAEILLVFFLAGRILKMSVSTAVLCFVVYSVLNGLTMSLIFLVYTASSIASVFFITAGTFAGMSVYAVTTKRDLSGMGHYLMMGLWGLIIASVVNLFLKSGMLDWITSIAGVGIFVGLTAYDTQIIKRWNAEAAADETVFVRLSILGALRLYLDFINLFLRLLRLLGRRRN
jgi:FtsH-binding integral membrane protein